jgi:hypothetical protein
MLQPSATYISLIIWWIDDCLYAFIRLFYMPHRSFCDTSNIWELRSSGLSSGHFLATFRDNPIVPNEPMGPIGCPETSVRNYHYSLRNNPEERSSQLPRGGSLKSRISNLSPLGFFSFFYFFILVSIFYTGGHNMNYSVCFCREMCGTLSPS